MTASTAGAPRPTTGHGLRSLTAVALGAAALLLMLRTADIVGGDVMDGTVWRSVDTRGLVVGADEAIACARDGTWRGCGALAPGEQFSDYPDVPGSKVDRFPPLLYLPAILVQGAGGSTALSLRIIGILSLVSFGVLVAMPWIVGARARGLHRHRYLWVVLVLASPLLPYAGSTWSEVHAAALLALAVALVAAEAPPALVALVAFAAGLSKDTAPLFVIGLAFAVARHVPRRAKLGLSPAFIAVVAGSCAALVVTAAFNFFRFGSFTNASYLARTFQVRRPTAVAGQALALVGSPNGGVLAFWPAGAVLLVLAVATWRRSPRGVRARLAVVAATTTGFLLSLALWWSPFGWAAWSPRLSLPLLAALAVAVLVLTPPTYSPPTGLLLAAGIAVLLAVPQAGITGNARGIGEFMVAPRSSCASAARQEDEFVRCNLDRAWRQHPGLLVAGLDGLRNPRGGLLAGAVVTAGLALVLRWKEATRSDRKVDRLLRWGRLPRR